MSKEMTLPKIGVNMTEAIISEWKVGVGDKIEKDDLIMVAETDKAIQDIFATDSGIIGKLLYEEGDNVQCHEPIMILLEDGEELSKTTDKKEVEKPQRIEKVQKSAEIIKETKAAVETSRVKISPLAKKMAKEAGLKISRLSPSSAGKRIVKQDVQNYIAAMENTPDEPTSKAMPLSAMRKVIAQRMSQSNSEIPSAALTTSVDAKAMIRLRGELKKNGASIGYNEIILKACAKALKEHTDINSKYEKGHIAKIGDVNVGLAVDTQKGLVVPVIKNADTLSLGEISADLTEKIQRIKDGKIVGEDINGGTFTVTNLGMLGIEEFEAIINPPQCAILAVGSIKRIFVPDENDQPVIREEMKMTLSFDHRIVDGAPAARFLQDVKKYVENPGLMLI